MRRGRAAACADARGVLRVVRWPQGASNFNGDLSRWDVANVTDMLVRLRVLGLDALRAAQPRVRPARHARAHRGAA